MFRSSFQTVDKPSAGRCESSCGQRASQSFPARRRENKIQSAKTKDMCLGFCAAIGQVCANGVRAAQCKFPFDQNIVLIESVSTRRFRHALTRQGSLPRSCFQPGQYFKPRTNQRIQGPSGVGGTGGGKPFRLQSHRGPSVFAVTVVGCSAVAKHGTNRCRS